MKYTVIRSDISRIQARLFDILTVRISNKDNTLIQMYYDHQHIDDYVKALRYETLYKVSFPVENLEEFKELERNLILGKLEPAIDIKLPTKKFDVEIAHPYSKIVVKSYFFQEEKRNMFYQKATKYFTILDHYTPLHR